VEVEVIVVKIKLSNLFIIFLFNSYFVTAGEKKEYFTISSDSLGNETVIGSVFVNNDFQVTELQTTVNNSSSINALEYYYTLGKENNTSEIKKISYGRDGSLNWMNREIKAIPDKFSGFKKLHKVDATKHLFWGGYDIYVVDWYIAKDKKLMSWYDSVYCENGSKCFISNLMINGDENSGIYADAIKLSSQSVGSSITKFPYKLAVLPDTKATKQQHPLDISFKIDWLKKPYVISLNDTEENTKSKVTVKELVKISDFFTAIWRLNAQQSSVEAQKAGLTKAISENWLDFNPRKMFSVLDQNKNFKKSTYLPSAYIQKLTKIDSYLVLGYLHAESETYIIGKGKYENSSELILFAINNTDYKLKQSPKNKALHTTIYSAIFHQKLNDIVRER